jgi:hypothetical protein
MCADTQLQSQIERHILTRTGYRVFNLFVEIRPEGLVLRGQANSYHVKQLAQHGARELLPTMPLDNSIAVIKPCA